MVYWILEHSTIGDWEIEQQYESFLFDVQSQIIKMLKCKRKRGMDVNIDVLAIKKSILNSKDMYLFVVDASKNK